jgi:non-ribosomal peptide synthetase component F/acyl carrier protein
MQYTERDRIPLFSSMSTGQGSNGVWCALLNGAALYPFAVRTKGITGLDRWIIDNELTVYVSSASIFRTLVKAIDERLVFSNIRAVRLSSEAVTADDIRLVWKHFPPTSVFVHTLSSSETSNIAWSRWTRTDQIPEGAIPVGTFSRDIEVMILGDNDEPVARGVTGEIVVKSRYVAAGYWRDPQLTAEKFSDVLDDRGTRQVRTGDRGRINADGLLEFRGRTDERIKIRGNRIELADIEQALQRLPGINGAAVVVIPRKAHEPMLAAFVVQTADASWTASRLRHALAANLPIHMVPTRFVFLDKLPYNRGNKIDREALRQYSVSVHDDGAGAPPQTDTEILLSDMWAEQFDRSRVNRDDDFFSLGGDSLSAAVVAAQVHAALGVELNLAAFAEHSTLSALAAFIDERVREGAVAAPPIVRVPRAAAMPVSLFQERIWKLCQTPAVGEAYMHPHTYNIKGPLKVDILKECLRYLIERHEVLRTTFDTVDGRLAQVIHSATPFDFSTIDLTGTPDAPERANQIFHQEASKAIGLSRPPLLRFLLVRISEDEHWLLRVFQPIIADGSSWHIFLTELAILYEAKLRGADPPIPKEAPLHYADYAVWQRAVLRPDGSYFLRVAAWWEKLSATPLPATRLPFRRWIRRSGVDPREGIIKWKLKNETAQRLDEFARSAGVTHFIVRLAACAALVADMTGHSKVIIGTHFANRGRAATQNMLGLFTNLAPLVLSFDAGASFREWVETVRDRLFETEMHCEIPFEDLRERFQAAGFRPPDVRIIFAMSSDHAEQSFGNLQVSHRVPPTGMMPWGCTIYVDERVPENCRVNFDAGLYRRNGMQEMLNRYLILLEAIAREPDQPVATLLATTGAKPLRWTFANYAAAAYDFLASRRPRAARPLAGRNADA